MNTRKLYLLPLLSLLLVTYHSSAQLKYPEAEIKNEHLSVKLYLPDPEQGYYRATRFDWSGVIGSLQYKSHEYFGPWLEKHDPTVHEAISGPVEAFAPIGFDEAKKDDLFLTVGVGMLRKPDEAPFRYSTTYEIANGGVWRTKRKSDRVEFVHVLTSTEGYAYEYTKIVRLVKGKPELILENRLKNTGKKSIETTAYNHNFFIIDGEPTGPNIVTRFPFPVQAEGRGFGDIIVAENNSLIYKKNVAKGDHVITHDLRGFGSDAADYNIKIENIKSGAGVHITSDQPLLKFVYWACATTACPEPYIKIAAKPGETFRWMTRYSFYTLPATEN